MKTAEKFIIASIFLSMMFVLSFLILNVAQAQYYSSNCTYHAYKLCSGNNIYWYDSCGTQQDLYYSCTGGQICQYGQCVAYVQPIQPINNYSAYYRIACYGNVIYWYDSLGVISGLYKSCGDGNSCTLDSCSTNKCENALKCDGSTCTDDSADYNIYCLPAQPSPTTETVQPIINTTPDNSNQDQTAAALSSTAVAESSGFWEFLKRWYLWIAGALVLIFLFIVVFRRFFSDT